MAKEKKVYIPPVSPEYIGDRPAAEMNLSIISYDADSAQIRHLYNIEELSLSRDDSKISWINVSGLKDLSFIKRLGELYGIHPLTVEDILHTEQQPKIEIFDNYRFLSLKTIQREKHFSRTREKRFPLFGKMKKGYREEDGFMIDQLGIIIMKNTLITFQETSGNSFEGVRRKIAEGTGDIRKTGPDYLAYAVIDAVVDGYTVTLNHLEDDIEDFEDRATKTSDYRFIEEIQDTKKYLLRIRRAISPLRDILLKIIYQSVFFQTDELKPFLQDLSDHLNHAIITVENYREWLTSIMDENLSVLTYQMNKVMKVLAIISTIFIPLTFIAGVYGMNFKFMPELESPLGYPLIMGGMGLIALIMIIFFKIRRWF